MTGTTVISPKPPAQSRPATWVPTVYFAEGIPYYIVNFMALLFFQKMGVTNARNTVVISLLALPWTLKPIWSPMLEMYKTKKFFVVLMQLASGVCLVLVALSLHLPVYFRVCVALFAVLGFCSATHDIATDGIYIATLTSKQQAAWIGWIGGFYNLGRVFAMGGLVWLVGVLGKKFAAENHASPLIDAWMVAFAIGGAVLLALGLYHSRMLPAGGAERKSESLRQMAATFADVVVSFVRKPNVLLLLVFILLYRAGEGQVIKVGPLFLQALRANGGLGLDPEHVGAIYGLFGTVSFFVGSVLGGHFTSSLGLKRALPWLILIMNLPMLAYWYLSVALPTGSLAISTAISVEMFGYGFGYVGVMLLMMQEIAPGNYQTAHYAFANSLMNLGLILPGAISGWIQSQLGYPHFFIWVIISSAPALLLARFIPVRLGGQPQPGGAA